MCSVAMCVCVCSVAASSLLFFEAALPVGTPFEFDLRRRAKKRVGNRCTQLQLFFQTTQYTMSRISQETFNEAVEENIREFGMSREEAVADAVVQFEAQGVDLSNIVKDASEEGHPVLNAANTLKAFIEGAEGTSASAAAAALARVVAECAKDPSNRDVAGFNGIVRNAVFFANRVNLDLGAAGAAELEERLSHLKTAIEAVRALTFMHNENRNQVPVAFLDVLVDCTAPERPLELQR